MDTVLSYSDDPVKDSGTAGSGACHVNGCSLAYLHKEYPETHALSSGRVELLYTLRCLNTIRLARWEGRSHHRLDNEGGWSKNADTSAVAFEPRRRPTVASRRRCMRA